MKLKISRPKTEMEKKKDKRKSHQEAAVNTVIGVIINLVILYLFSIPLHTSLILTSTLILSSYARSYLIRRAFNRKAS